MRQNSSVLETDPRYNDALLVNEALRLELVYIRAKNGENERELRKLRQDKVSLQKALNAKMTEKSREQPVDPTTDNATARRPSALKSWLALPFSQKARREFALHRDVKLIDGVFDKTYYLDAYEDVRLSGMDPAVHYLRYGWQEGRNPNAWFSTNEYKTQNALSEDVNPLLHYVKLRG